MKFSILASEFVCVHATSIAAVATGIVIRALLSGGHADLEI
jgi:hypothetical protein